ncbi:MAG: hypothetical protein EOO88_22360, partial [Pedobacter sp.]
MKYLYTLSLSAALFAAMPVQAQKTRTLTRPVTVSAADQKMNAFVKNLMAKMTLDEKIGQLNLP